MQRGGRFGSRGRPVEVDDRSVDRTGEIFDEFARGDERLEVVHVDSLPEGWLGKNHANHLGASRATSRWLLFTDGDVHFQPASIRLAMARILATKSDHLTAFPRLLKGGLWEGLVIAAFSMFFFFRYQPWLVRTRFKGAYVGVGAFNLISREAYESIGTHRRLAMDVTDDVKLGKLVKEHEFRQDVVNGDELCSVRWQVGLKGFVHGLTKNAFAAK